MTGVRQLPTGRARLPVIAASAEELARHEARLDDIAKASGGQCLWRGVRVDEAG
jgi:DNA polymerase-3 subunit epsilon